MMILAIILFVIFFILGLIHLNWALGSKQGIDKTIPTKENGEKLFTPRKIDSTAVGLGLIVFGLFYLIVSGLISFELPVWLIKYGAWIIPGIFILRAIGEFKYIGLFKRIKQTEFGKLDTKLYSPLCLLIGTIGLVIILMR